MAESTKWRLSQEDVKKFIRNCLVFLAPIAVYYFVAVSSQIDAGGFKWEYFVPNESTVKFLALYVVNILIDFFKKLIKDNTK